MSNVNFTNGKWRLSARARESGDFVYKDGDWFPKTKKKQKPQPKTPETNKKMNCGAFPLGKIKEFLKITTIYAISSMLGVSLAVNVFLYLEVRALEINNLQLIEILKEK